MLTGPTPVGRPGELLDIRSRCLKNDGLGSEEVLESRC